MISFLAVNDYEISLSKVDVQDLNVESLHLPSFLNKRSKHSSELSKNLHFVSLINSLPPARVWLLMGTSPFLSCRLGNG